MMYNAQKHRRAFEDGVKNFVASRVPGQRWFRNRVIAAAIKVLPATDNLTAYGLGWGLREITDDPKFKSAVGSIWLLLFSYAIQAIVKALLEYWFETKEREGYE